MKIVIVFWVGYFLSVAGLEAGSVYLTADGTEIHGKLTLAGSSIQVEGAAGPAIDLADVLEADFADTDFRFDYFSSADTAADGLPPGWLAQDIGHAEVPGTATFAKGVFTVSGTGQGVYSKSDRYYYLSRPWTGNGDWTIHVQDIGNAEVGPMLRETLDPGSVMYGVGTGKARPDGGGNANRHSRNNAGDGSAWNAFRVPEPYWMRLRRNGSTFDLASSSDGKTWNLAEQIGMKFPLAFQAGFYLNSNSDKVAQKAVVDNVLFTPLQAEPAMFPGGVLLCDGTFLAGTFDGLDPENGIFTRGEQLIAMTTPHVAAAIFDPVTTAQLAKAGGKSGVLFQNEDFKELSLKSIQQGSFDTASTVPGEQHFESSKALAYVLHAVAAQPSDYEVRLTDGSCIQASSISASSGQVAINEVGGLTVMADVSEVAQIRAGSTYAQTLTDFPWQATPETVPVPNATAATNAVASVQCWQGTNQEHIMAVKPGTRIDFPFNGQFRAMALSVALSSGAAAGSQATIRIIADGMEVAHTHAIKAGDKPRFVQVALQNPKVVTLVANGAFAGEVLFIDPVAVRK